MLRDLIALPVVVVIDECPSSKRFAACAATMAAAH